MPGPLVVAGAHRRPASGLLSRRPSRAETGTWRGTLWTLVVAANLFLMSNPLVFVASMDRSLTLAAMITGAALVLTFPRVRSPRVAWPVLLFLGWLLLSVTWSIQPAFTAAAWAQTAVIAAVALAVGANVSARVLVSGFAIGGVVAVIASFVAFHERLPGGFFEPLSGPVWAGIGLNPNILAYTLTLSLCGVCACVPRRAWTRLLWAGAIGLIAWGLHESASSTGDLTAAAVVITAVLLAAYGPVTRRFLRTTAHRVLAIVAAAAAMVGAYFVMAKVLGQDLITFSDRTPLWSASLEVAEARPFGGFGYGAVWQHPWKPPLLNVVIGDIWDRSGQPLSHGHNSVIDLVIEVGIVGVALMLVIMVAVALRARALARMAGPRDVDDKIMARFTVLCLVNLLVFGITEPMSTIPLGWWALVLLTEPSQRQSRTGEAPS